MNQWEVYEVLKKPSTAEISKLEETPFRSYKRSSYRVSSCITTRESE